MHGTKNTKFVIASYPKLFQNTVTDNHVARVFHQELANQFHLLEEPYSPYYRYEPHVAPENDNYKLCCNSLFISTGQP